MCKKANEEITEKVRNQTDVSEMRQRALYDKDQDGVGLCKRGVTVPRKSQISHKTSGCAGEILPGPNAG